MPKIATPQSRLGIEFSLIVSIFVGTFFTAYDVHKNTPVKLFVYVYLFILRFMR